MQLYKTKDGAVLVNQNKVFLLTENWDVIINRSNLHQHLSGLSQISEPLPFDRGQQLLSNVLAPIENQEVWAAGVTYLLSRDARMEESKESGASDVYSKVYDADRPELFFKALAHRVSAPGEEVYIRKDSSWNVPEPELTLYINSNGEIQAYTVGNDMSSRSIEGENPLYLPQAKVYERSCALGPCLFVPEKPISQETQISISIKRNHQEVFTGSIQLNRMKRNLPELASWLYKACKFQNGSFLMTGTGIVPSNEFTLQAGDEVSITIEGIGMLTNTVQVI
jgi:2-dehydro-3-deoxy-D-arabinonate dehydratase